MTRIFIIFFLLCTVSYFSQSASELEELMEACGRGDVKTIKSYLVSGIRVNSKSDSGRLAGKTPLMIASMKGKREVVRLLLENGAEVNMKEDASGSIKRQPYDGWTALFYAADSDHEEVVRILVSNGADVNMKTKAGITPLSLAKLWQNEEMVRTLKNAGAVE